MLVNQMLLYKIDGVERPLNREEECLNCTYLERMEKRDVSIPTNIIRTYLTTGRVIVE